MQEPSIIYQTAIACAQGAAYGAAFGALINPVMGVGAGAVLGAVAPPVACLVAKAIQRWTTPALKQLSDRLHKIERPWVKLIAAISRIFAGVVLISLAITVPFYAGLYVGKYALAALGFNATIAPSLSLAAKFFLPFLACSVGCELAIRSVKALWNRIFSREDQGQEATVQSQVAAAQ